MSKSQGINRDESIAAQGRDETPDHFEGNIGANIAGGRYPSAAYTEEQLHAALIFWIARCRRFEEKLDQFGYMKARGVLRPEFALGNRIFEESLPTVEDIVGLVPDMNPEAE